MQKPDVELIEGLPPTIAIEQRTGPSSPRSTVATVTEIYDYLRLLYARVGTPYCHRCNSVISRQTIDQMTQRVMDMMPGTKVMLLAPLVKGKKGEHLEIFQSIIQKGFVRARIDGTIVDLKAIPKLARYKTHEIDVIVDRLVIKEGIEKRLYDSMETCLTLGEGVMLVSQEQEGAWVDLIQSERYACHTCGSGYEELTPRMFSFNSPYGICTTCDGLGSVLDFDQNLIVPNKRLSIKGGARLRPEALSVRLGGKSISEIMSLTVEESGAFFKTLTLDNTQAIIAKQLLKEIQSKLRFMLDVGLHYLTLGRSSDTLSGGEAQRTQLAKQVGSGLVGVCYVLDEPTIGLHPRDNERLLNTLLTLRDIGNTVVVVEHDEHIIRHADYLVDVGPGAGTQGGEIVAQRTRRSRRL